MVQLEMERRKNYAFEHGIQKLEYAPTDTSLPAELSAAVAVRFLAGKSGTVRMKGIEELFGSAMVSIWLRGKRDAKIATLLRLGI